MAEFTPINTQEEFDAAIQSRINRERQKFADYDSIKEQLTEAQTTITSQKGLIDGNKEKMDSLKAELVEKESKIKEFELKSLKVKVATDKNLPYELADYLKGNTEEELAASADIISKFATQKKVPPLADPETDPPADTKDMALIKMRNSLFNN